MIQSEPAVIVDPQDGGFESETDNEEDPDEREARRQEQEEEELPSDVGVQEEEFNEIVRNEIIIPYDSETPGEEASQPAQDVPSQNEQILESSKYS